MRFYFNQLFHKDLLRPADKQIMIEATNLNQNHEKALDTKLIKFVPATHLNQEIVNLIADGHFQQAILTLKKFSEGEFLYPSFKSKTERYISHSIDIILVLEANKNFVGFSSLTRTKQQQLKEKFNNNYDELKNMMNKVYFIHHEFQAKDNQSTKYVVKSVWLSLVFVSVSLAAFEIYNGLGSTVYLLLDSGINAISSAIYKLI